MQKKLAWAVIITIAAITAFAVSQIPRLRFDYAFENFFPTNDTDLDFYRAYQKKFEPDIDFVLVGIRNEAGIFDSVFLDKVARLEKEFEAVSHVRNVISPLEAKDYVLGPFGPIAVPWLHPKEPGRYAQDSARIYENLKGVGSFFSQDGTSLSLVLEIEPNLSKVRTDSVYYGMQEVAAHYHFTELHMSGKAIGQNYYISKIKEEFVLFFLLGVLLIVIILWMVYRSFWGIIVPLAIVLLSVVWLLGLMGLTGKNIDILNALLPTILFVVGISDVIHLLSRYFEELRKGRANVEAIRIAYRQIGLATALTSLTTAIGFLTLVYSDIMPIKELGIYAALGVLIAFVLAFSLLPAILVLHTDMKLALKEPASAQWHRLSHSILRFSLNYRKQVLIGFLALAILSIIGIGKVEIDNFLLEDVGEGDPTRVSFEFFEEHFAGVRPFEMHLTLKDTNGSLYDYEAILEMAEMERYLRSVYGVGFVVSPLQAVRGLNQALHGGKDSAFVIPSTKEEMQALLPYLEKFQHRPEFDALITDDLKEGRIAGKMVDVGGRKIKEMNTQLHQYFTLLSPLKHLDYRLTGMALLIDKNNEKLSKNLIYGLFFAFAVVAVIMGLLFRSMSIVVISLIPNMVPLLVIGGAMGFAGVDLKVSTSIIFGISFGIAVDDTIHYLAKFKLQLREGKSYLYAIKRTSISTGKAIMLTSLIICSGFVSMAFSSFKSSIYIGTLVGLTLLVAVISDLVLLPVLLLFWAKVKKHRS